jgi:hypothetical protein
MTYKEKVLSVYPDVILFEDEHIYSLKESENYDFLNKHPFSVFKTIAPDERIKFSIKENYLKADYQKISRFFISSINDNRLIKWFATKSLAWKDAWKAIEQNILDKLES